MQMILATRMRTAPGWVGPLIVMAWLVLAMTVPCQANELARRTYRPVQLGQLAQASSGSWVVVSVRSMVVGALTAVSSQPAPGSERSTLTSGKASSTATPAVGKRIPWIVYLTLLLLLLLLCLSGLLAALSVRPRVGARAGIR